MVKRWLIRVVHAASKQHKGVGFLSMFAILIALVSATVLFAPPANAGTPSIGQGQGLGSSYSGGVATCAIETVGWVICPVMRSIAKLADYGFAFINESFLRIGYEFSGGDSGIFVAWELMRNIANVLLVLIFLYIVYTQITGRNSGNFNLKRILPRLIMGAILLNISYYICAGAVQLSDITGNAIVQIMTGVAEQIGTPAMSLTSAENGFEDGVLTDITASILTKPGTVWILLAPVAAVTIAIATICAAGLVLLIMRKVVVSMLVLVSPILFVAYLLPNLERFFQQWARLFIQLLLLYPIVAFLLGTGQIVSATIISVGTGGETDYSVQDDDYNSKNGTDSAITDLAAAGAAVLPLLGVWFMLKNVSALMSTAGSRLAANVGGRSKSKAEKAEAAQMSGKAQFGARQAGKTGVDGGEFAKRPAFTRRRRKASIGGSAVAPSDATRQGSGNTARPGLASALDNMLGGGVKSAAASQEAAAQQAAAAEAQKLQQGQVDADGLNVDAAAIQAQMNSKDDDKKKGKSAKDIFNNMNKARPLSKDQQRSLGGAGNNGGGGGGSGGEGQASGPTAPSTSFKAPTVAQAGGVPTAPPSGGGKPTVIAVPVQIDASALLGQPKPATDAASTVGQFGVHDMQPVTGTEAKAKARAQKYIFDAASDVDAARKDLDLTNDQADSAVDINKELKGDK